MRLASAARPPWVRLPTSKAFLGVGMAAALPRMLWVVFMSRSPVGLFDPAIYMRAGESIAAGHGYRSLTGTPTSYYPPVYPFFLGAIRWITGIIGLAGHFVLIVGIVQAALGVASALAVMVIAWRIGGRGCGIAGGVLFAFWPNLVIHTSLLLSETLFIALFLGSLLALLAALDAAIQGSRWLDLSRSANRRALPMLALAGVLCGLAVLTRPQSALLLIPAVALAYALNGAGWRRSIELVAVLAIGVVIVVLPWGIRNQVVLGSFVPFSTNTGDNLCIGFNPDANGGFAMPPACQTTGSYTDGPKEELSRDAQLRRSSLAWARSNPRRIPALSATKVRLTFSGDHDALRAAESFGDDPFIDDRLRSVLRFGSDTYYLVVLGLAVIGATLVLVGHFGGAGRRRSTHGGSDPRAETTVSNSTMASNSKVLATTTLLIVLFGVAVPVLSFGDQRFKVPLEPFMAVLAAMTLQQATELVNRRRPQRNDGATPPATTSDGATFPADPAPNGPTGSGI